MTQPAPSAAATTELLSTPQQLGAHPQTITHKAGLARLRALRTGDHKWLADILRVYLDRYPSDQWGHSFPVDVLMPGVAGLPPLIDAFWSKDGECLKELRGQFEDVNEGSVIDSYFGPLTQSSCVVLLRKTPRKGYWPPRRKVAKQHLFVWIGRRHLIAHVSEFADVLWRTLWLARRTEGPVDPMLPAASRAVVSDMLYTVAVFLLASLDAIERKDGETLRDIDVRDLQAAAKSGSTELDKLEHFLNKETIRATVRYYLIGFFLGAMMLAVPVTIIRAVELPEDVRWLLILSILAGGIGSITSVMVRITRGQNLSVDTRQGVGVTLLAGSFRPLVGAVFGVVFYLLVVSKFIPVEIAAEKEHFYASLAFLAGFSERWAQDTIVRSTPISPSPATRRGEAESDAKQATD
jgi:hypothetical protein